MEKSSIECDCRYVVRYTVGSENKFLSKVFSPKQISPRRYGLVEMTRVPYIR